MDVYQLLVSPDDAIDDMSVFNETVSIHASEQGALERKAEIEAVINGIRAEFDTRLTHEYLLSSRPRGDTWYDFWPWSAQSEVIQKWNLQVAHLQLKQTIEPHWKLRIEKVELKE